jgi:hypothetical protein
MMVLRSKVLRSAWAVDGRTVQRLAAVLAAALLAACSGMSPGDTFSGTPAAPTQPGEGGASIGAGQVKAGLVLPLSASGNAGAAGTAMRSAAEMALAEFNVTDLQLLVKDDGGNAPGARQVAQQAIDEGAEIILGPIFAHSVSPVGQLARSRNVPVMAFSTDANVATRGVYLLSFLPESDVDRIVSYAISRRGGRIVALEHYAADRNQMQAAIRTVAQAAARADAIFIPDGSDSAPAVVQALGASGVDLKRVQILGSGLWEDPQIFTNSALEGAWYAGPDATGFRNFSSRFRARYGQDPARTASLAYDAVALISALVKTQGDQRFSEQVLINSSGFTGIDGLFRFRADGTNQRGLAVMKVTPAGGQVISPAPKAFNGSGAG